MGAKLIKIASIYFVIGVLFGMFMSMTHNFGLASVHAHINLLGWASLALAGLIYSVYPIAGETPLAKAHFWLHNIGLPIMMIGLIVLVSGVPSVEPVIAVGGLITVISVILFMINVLKNVNATYFKSKGLNYNRNKTTPL
jgi:hypothetical protein